MFGAYIFKSRRRLEAENLFLRHQLNVALRRAAPRLRLHGSDRALLVSMRRIWPTLLDVSQVVKPETTCDGIVLASQRFGAGNPEIGQGGRKSLTSSAISSDG